MTSRRINGIFDVFQHVTFASQLIVRSLMYCRDTKRLAEGAANLRWLRRVANSWFVLFLVALFLNLLLWLLPAIDRDLIGYIWAPFGFMVFVGILPWFVVGICFTWGIIKCPCCNERFTRGYIFRIGEECQHCGFNVKSLHRNGDF